MKRLFIIALASLAAWSASAQTDTILSLQQCIDMALANNAAMKIAANNSTSARELKEVAFTKYFPEVAVEGLAFASSDYMVKLDVLNTLNIEFVRHGVAAGIQAIQPVFMGGRILNANRLAEVGIAVAELQRSQTANQVRLTTEKYYWQLATLKSTRHTLDAAMMMLDTLERQVGVAVKAGIVTNNELLKVKLQRNEFAAKQVDLDNGIKLCRMVLSQYVGAPVMHPVDIDAPIPSSVPDYPLNLRVDPVAALPDVIDYKLLNEQVKARTLEEKIEYGKQLPTVAAAAGWFFHNIPDKSTTFGTIGIAVTIPITGWWTGNHSVKRARIAVENARLQRDDLSQMLEINMQNKWDDLTSAHRKMQIANESITQSAENLRLNREFYKAGTATITNLLDAQMLNQKALDEFFASYGGFCVARAEYLNATGR